MTGATAFLQQLANTIAQLCYRSYQVRCRADEMDALYNVASMLSGRVELQEILDTATKTLVDTMKLRAAVIRLLDEDTGELRIESVAHLPMSYLDTEPILLSAQPYRSGGAADRANGLRRGHSHRSTDLSPGSRTQGGAW